jgi:membrane fusion protein
MALFREEAIAAKKGSNLSSIILIRPLSFTFFTLLGLACTVALCSFFAWGSYTKKTPVIGQLVPQSGLIKVYASQAGRVSESHVNEGDQVKAGEVLFVITNERQSGAGAAQEQISGEVKLRQASLRDTIQKTRALQNDERNAASQKIDALTSERDNVDNQIKLQTVRVELAQHQVDTYQGLMDQKFVSREQVITKQTDLLDQQTRLANLQRDRITVDKEILAQKADLAALPNKQATQISELDRQLESMGQELTESEAKRRLVVTAPADGIATAVLAAVGQEADLGRPLVSIVPAGEALKAELYAPSGAVGFINPGDKVWIRYRAFPYQKFGHQEGIVKSVSRTALPAADIAPILASSSNGSSEPVYRIDVDLVSQSISAYGKARSLQAGMTLDADVVQESRHLYEWVLEPLYSLTGKA